MSTTEKEILERRTTSQKVGYDRFMNKPSIRLLMSMISPGQNPDILETLLKEAYTAGSLQGEGFISIEMLTKMMEKHPNGR
jgi:hypothetical protein